MVKSSRFIFSCAVLLLHIPPLLLGLYLGSTWYHYSPLYTQIEQAVAVIHPTKNNFVHGTVTFTLQENGVRVVAYCTNLPEGKHGFHVHEHGDCRCDDGMCTGGHFNPTSQPHGGPNNTQRHIGDMGNIVVDKNGNGHLDYVDKQLKINGPHSIVGRSIIIHADEDDLISQPTGNAGKRIGCGVIGTGKH